MNPSDEKDELWNLLGKARPPAVSPFFARNIVREVRGSRQEQPGFFAMIQRHWKLTAMAAALGCLVTVTAFDFIGSNARNQQVESLLAITEQVSDSPDFYVINDLDNLLASEESSVWLENSTY